MHASKSVFTAKRGITPYCVLQVLFWKPLQQSTHSQNVPVSHSVSSRVSSVNTNEVKTFILLQSASVEVRGQKGVAHANVLYDTDSDRSFISEVLSG